MERSVTGTLQTRSVPVVCLHLTVRVRERGSFEVDDLLVVLRFFVDFTSIHVLTVRVRLSMYRSSKRLSCDVSSLLSSECLSGVLLFFHGSW